MADRLYLSLWFPNFRLPALAPAIVCVLKQWSAVGQTPRVRAASAYPISWNETPFYQRIYGEDEVEESAPEQAVPAARFWLTRVSTWPSRLVQPASHVVTSSQYAASSMTERTSCG